jgi:alpha/beta superfamily hydrolase
VGASTGVYDNAVGEQDDLKAVIAWVEKTFPDCKLWLAGFSFGSYVAAKVATEKSVEQLITIALSVNRFDFKSLTTLTCPWLVVQGEADEIVPAEDVFDWLASRSEKPKVIRMPGVGHYFHGKLIELREAIVANLQSHTR